MKKTLWLLALVCIANISFGQVYKKTLKKADQMYEYQDYRSAIPLFLEVLQYDANNVDANFKLGHCYLNTTYNHKAQKYLEVAYRLNADFDPSQRYDLAEAYHLNHQFEDAIKFFEREKATLHPKKQAMEISLMDKKIFECKNGIELMKSPINVKIENIGDKVNGK